MQEKIYLSRNSFSPELNKMADGDGYFIIENKNNLPINELIEVAIENAREISPAEYNAIKADYKLNDVLVHYKNEDKKSDRFRYSNQISLFVENFEEKLPYFFGIEIPKGKTLYSKDIPQKQSKNNIVLIEAVKN